MTADNSYTGVTTLNGGTLSVASISNGGTAGPTGAATAAAGNILFTNGGTLKYTGPAVSTDRLFTVGTLGGSIDASGTGALQFTNLGSIWAPERQRER